MDFELAIVEASKPIYEWRFIATCPLPDGDETQAFTRREIHANANLIAAAPDMAEALECALIILRDAPSTLGRDLAEAKVLDALSCAYGNGGDL